MTTKNPKLGAKSKCKDCGNPITYTGKYWEHVGTQYRHPARPINLASTTIIATGNTHSTASQQACPYDCEDCKNGSDCKKCEYCGNKWAECNFAKEPCNLTIDVTNISNCSRCGKDHEHLIFSELANPPDNYTYWAMCPNTNQPILMEREWIDASCEEPDYSVCPSCNSAMDIDGEAMAKYHPGGNCLPNEVIYYCAECDDIYVGGKLD